MEFLKNVGTGLLVVCQILALILAIVWIVGACALVVVYLKGDLDTLSLWLQLLGWTPWYALFLFALYMTGKSVRNG